MSGIPETPRAREDVVFRELGDEWVLFDPKSQKLHLLNLSGALVWSHCDGERDVGEIVRRVRDAFEDPPSGDEARRDVRRVLETFAREGLVE